MPTVHAALALGSRMSLVSQAPDDGSIREEGQQSRSPLRLDALTRLRFEGDARFVRTACLVLMVPTLWFSLSDVGLSNGDANWLVGRLLVRLALLMTLAAGAWFIPQSTTRAAYERQLLLVTLIGATAIIALNGLRPLSAGLPLRTPLMWLFALYIGFPSSPWRQFAAPLLLTAGIVAIPPFWNGSVPNESIAGNLMVLLTVNVLGVLLVLQRHALIARKATWERDTEQLLHAERAMLELKTLKGLIPICAYCKKVNTESGDWQHVEAYVRARSAAEFTHGFCPSCMALHYPQFVKDPEQQA